MDWLRENLLALLEFTPSQRRAIVFIFFIVVLTQILLHFLEKKRDDRDTEIIYTYIKSIQPKAEDSSAAVISPTYSFELFNPNKVSKDELIAFGMPSYLAERIERYRKAGGVFRKKADIKKIYGMTMTLYNAMERYIDIPDDKGEVLAEKKSVPAPMVPAFIDLNNTDTIQLMSLRGIGSKLSSRILKYGSSLGFYVHKEQLKEVWGISDSLYLTIEHRFSQPSAIDSLKLNINVLDRLGLQRHPYFRKGKLASAIVNYREQHGSFESIGDVLKIHLINDSIFHRIEPYICVDGH